MLTSLSVRRAVQLLGTKEVEGPSGAGVIATRDTQGACHLARRTALARMWSGLLRCAAPQGSAPSSTTSATSLPSPLRNMATRNPLAPAPFASDTYAAQHACNPSGEYAPLPNNNSFVLKVCMGSTSIADGSARRTNAEHTLAC